MSGLGASWVMARGRGVASSPRVRHPCLRVAHGSLPRHPGLRSLFSKRRGGRAPFYHPPPVGDSMPQKADYTARGFTVVPCTHALPAVAGMAHSKWAGFKCSPQQRGWPIVGGWVLSAPHACGGIKGHRGLAAAPSRGGAADFVRLVRRVIALVRAGFRLVRHKKSAPDFWLRGRPGKAPQLTIHGEGAGLTGAILTQKRAPALRGRGRSGHSRFELGA